MELHGVTSEILLDLPTSQGGIEKVSLAKLANENRLFPFMNHEGETFLQITTGEGQKVVSTASVEIYHMGKMLTHLKSIEVHLEEVKKILRYSPPPVQFNIEPVASSSSSSLQQAALAPHAVVPPSVASLDMEEELRQLLADTNIPLDLPINFEDLEKENEKPKKVRKKYERKKKVVGLGQGKGLKIRLKNTLR